MKNRNLNHSDNWATPEYIYKELDNIFHFDFDPCPLNHDINKWDGLKIEWGKRNFINPPYSRKLKEAFVLKAIEEAKNGKLCVMLLPVSTSTKLFHNHILPNAKDIQFVNGRIKFLGINTKGEYVTNKAPMHDSMIIVFEGAKTSKMPKLKKWIIPAVISSTSQKGWGALSSRHPNKRTSLGAGITNQRMQLCGGFCRLLKLLSCYFE